MLIAQQACHPSLLDNGLEELARNVRLEQPIAVLAEGRVIPHRLIDRQPDEPSEQKVVLDLLDQLLARARNGVIPGVTGGFL